MKFFAVLALSIVGAIAAPTAQQVNIVQSSWDQVKYNEVDILYAIFQANPDIQAKFPQFAGKDLASLKDTAAFATHAGRIVGYLSEVIALEGSASNAPAVATLISQLAASHKGRGVSQAQFNEFRASLVSYLQANASYDAAAWTAVLDSVYGQLFAAL